MIRNHFLKNSSRSFVFGFAWFSVIAILFPLITQAQGLLLKSPKATYNVGDSFSVSLTLDTKGQSINTLGATIFADKTRLQIVDVRYGSSIISLWVERPKIDSSGNITFVGGVPGGFSGSAGQILTFGARAKSEGQAAISIKDIKILLNDGKGTELVATSGVLKLTIQKATPSITKEATKKEIYAPPPDTIPPENFLPLVSRNSTVADNKYFVSFFAVDKDSGVSYYEIREKPRILTLITTKFDLEPVRAETPYMLKGQFWAYKIIVRAYDQAGNYKDASAEKPFHPYLLWAGVILLVAVAVLAGRWYH